MKKIILVTDIPDDCYKIFAEIRCNGIAQNQIHILEYNEKEINDRLRAHVALRPQLEVMGIE